MGSLTWSDVTICGRELSGVGNIGFTRLIIEEQVAQGLVYF